MHLSEVAYVVVHDLEVRNSANNGINADDGGKYADDQATHHVVFRDLYVHDIGAGGNQDCLKLSGLRDYWVLDSRFARCGGGGSGSAVDHVGCHHGMIARNVFEELSGNAVQNKGGSSDIDIRWNHLDGAGERGVNLGGSTGYTYFRPPLSATAENAEAIDIRVVGNVIEGGVAALAYVGCDGCVVAHNTIVDPTNWLFRILQETVSDGTYDFAACRDGQFVNNIVYFDRSDLSTYVNIGPNVDDGSFVFANNVWYAHDDASGSTPTLPTTETDGVYASDPDFTDADFRIGSTSPAAGAGQAQGWLRGDRDGNCYADPPSAGAYEVP
jgi:hypothetical protein